MTVATARRCFHDSPGLMSHPSARLFWLFFAFSVSTSERSRRVQREWEEWDRVLVFSGFQETQLDDRRGLAIQLPYLRATFDARLHCVLYDGWGPRRLLSGISKRIISITDLGAGYRHGNTLANINSGDLPELSLKVFDTMEDTDVAGGGTKEDLEALTQSPNAISSALTLAPIAACFF